MRYIADSEEDTKRIIGGGRWSEEWFLLSTVVTFAVMMQVDDVKDPKERVGKLASALILDWSIVDKDGNKKPISYDSFKNLPFEMTYPIVQHVNSEDFLAQMSALRSPEKS